jgi:hypothetical protein
LHLNETNHEALGGLQVSGSSSKPRVVIGIYPWTKARATAKLAP